MLEMRKWRLNEIKELDQNHTDRKLQNERPHVFWFPGSDPNWVHHLPRRHPLVLRSQNSYRTEGRSECAAGRWVVAWQSYSSPSGFAGPERSSLLHRRVRFFAEWKNQAEWLAREKQHQCSLSSLQSGPLLLATGSRWTTTANLTRTTISSH